MTLVPPGEYAKMQGWHPSRVSKLIREGRVIIEIDPNGRRMVNVEESDRIIAETYHPHMKHDEGKVKEHDESSAATLAESKARREHYNAELAKLKLEEQRGLLINATEVQDAAFKLGRVVRDAMLALPDRMANEFANDQNPFNIHKRMTEEIRRALEALNAEGE